MNIFIAKDLFSISSANLFAWLISAAAEFYLSYIEEALW